MRLDDDIKVNWEASLTAKHVALAAMAQTLLGEYPSRSIAEIVETWGPLDLTDAERAAVREVFPDA